jgi:hypothetical protein
MYQLKIFAKDSTYFVQDAVHPGMIIPAFDNDPTFRLDKAMELVAKRRDDRWIARIDAVQMAGYLASMQGIAELGEKAAARKWCTQWAVRKLAEENRFPCDENGFVNWPKLAEMVQDRISGSFWIPAPSPLELMA